MSIKKINGYTIFMDLPLGHGTYGSVYKGQQDRTKLQCAVKIVNKNACKYHSSVVIKNSYLKQALESEIQIMSKVKSRNVVNLLDVLMSTHNYYIVQQICDSDFQIFLKKHHKLSEQEAIKFLIEICNGFIPLVKQGIIHRDLKPANILMSKGTLKIGDFGFAKKNIHKKILNESCVGTPLYMSIQVLKCLGYTSKCDIWSLGCIFYEMVHGYPPWSGKSEYQLVQNIQKNQLKINQKLSDSAINFLHQTLKIKQQDRISWDNLYKHSIFNGYFHNYINQNIEFQSKFDKFLTKLLEKLQGQNICLQSFLQNFNFQNNDQIQIEQFQVIVQEIDQKYSKYQKFYFFQKLDLDGLGFITPKQIQMCLQTVKQKKQLIKSKDHSRFKKVSSLQTEISSLYKQSDQNLQICGDWDQQFKTRVQNCFKRLYKIITSKSLTLQKAFMIYDKDNNGLLSVDEFSLIINRLDSDFTIYEIQQIFNQIDQNNSGSIQFEQLNRYYCKVNEIQIQQDNFTSFQF